jgi:ATP-dependent RNA helicase RhlE
VVNYDEPKEAEDFLHRAGRTGRAASYGVASTFAAPDEAHALKKIERTLAIHTKKYRVRLNSASVVSESIDVGGATKMVRSPRSWHQ